MSDRDKKLIIFFALAGFVILNFLGYKFASSRRDLVKSQREQAIHGLEIAEAAIANRDQVSDEIEWLNQHEPEPQANQDAQTTLQQLADREAKSTGLTIKNEKPQPT